MTIEEARERLGERVVCRLWDGSLVEGVIECMVGGDVFVRRAGGPGVLGSPEHVAQADLPGVEGVMF